MCGSHKIIKIHIGDIIKLSHIGVFNEFFVSQFFISLKLFIRRIKKGGRAKLLLLCSVSLEIVV